MGAVLKTVVTEQLGQAGSIPVRLRQRSSSANLPMTAEGLSGWSAERLSG